MVEIKRRFALQKNARLLNSSDYSHVFDSASIKVSHSHFLILARENNLNHARLGLIAAKRNLNRAVQRNRFKRLVRESFRLKQHHLPPFDAIVLARQGLENQANTEIAKTLNVLWNRVANKAEKLKKK